MVETAPLSGQSFRRGVVRCALAVVLVLHPAFGAAANLVKLDITPDLLSGNTVVGGNRVNGTVTLDAAAPAGGVAVALRSSDPIVATVPATVTVPAGAAGATFQVTTKAKLPGSTEVTITATLGAVARSYPLRVADDVTEYAKACYARLKIQEKDLPGPFRCKDGVQLPVQKDGKTLDIAINDVPNPLAPKSFPADCDFPAWLPNGEQCYGSSFIQQLRIAGNPAFEGALLCRHKTVWAGVCSGGANNGKTCGDLASAACGAGSKCILGDKDFPDIAVILYNKSNGETCWFQTPDTECKGNEPRCDGTGVPAPHTARAKQVFLPPSDTAGINCVRCHDNGPWMSSRWMDAATGTIGNGKALADDPAAHYLNNGAHFDKWAKTTFVTVKRDGLGKDGRACTACHKIHAKEITPDPAPPFAGVPGYGRNYITLAHWLDYSVAITFPPGASATGKLPDDDHALWMPFSRGAGAHGLTLAEWNKIYKPHVDALRACMEKKGVETADNKKKGSNCEVRLTGNNPAPGAPGARLRGNLSDGTAIVRQVTPSGFNPGSPIAVSPGTSMILSWDADSFHHACAIEASMPPGVPQAPATAGGWNLQDPPASLGPFTVPGEYRFDMYCEGEEGASFLLAVPGAAPSPKLHIEAIVDGFARPRATNIPGPAGTTANASVADAIFVYWGAESVKDDCVVTELRDPGATPTGRTFPGASGYIKVALAVGGNDQIYALACTGSDDKPYTVKTTLRPTAAVACDVNGDGSIDKADIDLIFARRNFAAVPNDRRDVQADNLITVNDARICATRCKNPKCAP